MSPHSTSGQLWSIILAGGEGTRVSTLVHRWFGEVWNQGREDTIDELFAAEGVGHGLGEGGAAVHGPAGFKPFARNLRSALPDIQIRIADTIVQGDKAVVRVTVEGTHLGEGLGLAPTKRRVCVSGAAMPMASAVTATMTKITTSISTSVKPRRAPLALWERAERCANVERPTSNIEHGTW